MSTSSERRIGTRAAEDLLNGASVGGHAHLGAVLRAAARPGHSCELAGRHQAIAEFQCRRRRAPWSPQRPPRFTALAVKLVTLKAAAAAALFVGAGGIAVAASTGVLPEPLYRHSTPTTSAGHAASTHRSAPSPYPSVGAAPSVSLVGLCHAYTAGAGAAQGKSLDNPRFRSLVTAADGKEHVNAYCDKLLGAQTPRPKPGRSGHASGGPSDHASHAGSQSAGAANGRRLGYVAVRDAGHSKARTH